MEAPEINAETQGRRGAKRQIRIFCVSASPRLCVDLRFSRILRLCVSALISGLPSPSDSGAARAEGGPEGSQGSLVERAAREDHAPGPVDDQGAREPPLPERVRELELLVDELGIPELP